MAGTANMDSVVDIGPTARLAGMVAGAQKFTEADRNEAVRAFVDTIGCIIAARDSQAARVAAEAVGNWGTGPAVTVRGDFLAAPWAALANGVAAHAEDYDDVLEPANAHVSAVLVPTLMALGAAKPFSGRAMLDAYLAGFEVMTRLGEAFGLIHYSRGWHTTLTLGAPAAAGAAARLLGMDARATATAISQSMSMSGGSKLHMGKIAKPVHAGLAAKAGVLAAALTKAGTTTHPEIFAGSWGAIEMMAGPEGPGFSPTFGASEHISAMTEYGVWFKAYPSCASTHRVVDGALALAGRHHFGSAEVARVDLTLPLTGSQNLLFEVPATPSEARFSAHYCVAHAIAEGGLGPDAFRQSRISRPDIVALMGRIHRRVDPAQTAPYADLSDLSAHIRVELADRRVFEEHVAVPYGHPNNPLSDADLDRKFLGCAEAGGFATEDAERLLQALRGISAQKDLSVLDWFGSKERP